MNNDIEPTIPADMLRFTISALDELAIQRRMSAEGMPSPAAEKRIEQSIETQKTANFYRRLYKRHLSDKETGEHEQGHC